MRSPDGTYEGHALVLPLVFWTHHPFQAGWFRDDLLDEMLDRWDAHQVVVGNDRRCDVRWLDVSASRTVAREVFDADLERERSTRT